MSRAGFGAATGAGGERACDVLIVDDEAVVRQGVARILEAHGLSVAQAADAASALAHPALARCRLVLCDLILPDRPGTELLRSLHGSRPDVPVVLITGYATAEHEERARRAGAREFLAKPFEEAELLEVVQRVLGSSGPAPQGRVS